MRARGHARGARAHIGSAPAECRVPAGAQKANQLNLAPEPCYPFRVSTLAEIEDAADALPPEQKQELFLFLAARLRGGVGQTPPPREFTQEQIEGWIADDEAGMRRFREER